MNTQTTMRVRFAETDQMGIAHHSAYVVWLEAARIEWLRERGSSYREMEDEGLSLAVSELGVSYRVSLRFDDEITIETRLSEAKSRRVRFDYHIFTPEGDLAASAHTLHTPTNRAGRAVRMPERWLAALTPFVSDD